MEQGARDLKATKCKPSRQRHLAGRAKCRKCNVGGLGGFDPLHRYNLDFTEVFLRFNPLHLALRQRYEPLQG
jgi:hypothetical protein